jgi:hypothetical protein
MFFMFSSWEEQKSYSDALAEISKAHAENAKIAALQSLIAVLQQELKLRWPFYHDEERQQSFIRDLETKSKEENLLYLIKTPSLIEGYSEDFNGPRLSNIEKFENMLDGMTNHIYLSSFLGANPRSQHMQTSIDLILAGPKAKTLKPTTQETQSSKSPAPAHPHNNTSVFQAVATDDPDPSSAPAIQESNPQQDLSTAFKTKLKKQLTDIIDARNEQQKPGKLNSAPLEICNEIKALDPTKNSQTAHDFINQIVELKDRLETASKPYFSGSKTLREMLKHGFEHTKEELNTQFANLEEQAHNPEKGRLNTIFKRNLRDQLTALISKGGRIAKTSRLGKLIKKIKELKPSDHSQTTDDFIEQILELKKELRTTSKYWIGGSKTLANMLKYGFNYTKEDLKTSLAKLNTQEHQEQLKQAKQTDAKNQAEATSEQEQKEQTRKADRNDWQIAAEERREESLPAPAERAYKPDRKLRQSTPPLIQATTASRQATPPPTPPQLLSAADIMDSFRNHIAKQFAGTGLEGLIFSRDSNNYLSEKLRDNKTTPQQEITANAAQNAITTMTKAIDSETTTETKELVFSITALFLYQLRADKPLSNPINRLFANLDNNEDRTKLKSIAEQADFKLLTNEPGILGPTEELTTFGKLVAQLNSNTDHLSTERTLPAGRLPAFIETMKNQQQQLCPANVDAQASSSTGQALISDATRQRVGDTADQMREAATYTGIAIKAGCSGFLRAGGDWYKTIEQSVNAGEPQSPHKSVEPYN